MGKIFEALEKAGTKNIEAIPISQDMRKDIREQKAVKKVVPLLNSGRNHKEGRLDDTLITFHAPQSAEAEIFKILRTNILFPASGRPPKTILVTSALPEDGKSFVISNLAISIARGVEEHVLLIDGDIRKPAIHQRFGMKDASGLSEYLARGDDIAAMIHKTPIEKLKIIPAGDPPPNPAELMSSKKMKALLNEVKSRYDDRYILIDSPPPAMASETNAVAQYVDAIIIVVRAGKTPRDAVADTIEHIGKEKLIGIVLNQADSSSTKFYGYEKTYY